LKKKISLAAALLVNNWLGENKETNLDTQAGGFEKDVLSWNKNNNLKVHFIALMERRDSQISKTVF
jgi:hypothetical protein